MRSRKNGIRGHMAGIVLTLLLAGTAAATPVMGAIVADTNRGALGESLKVNTKLLNGAQVHLKTKGPVEVITQRIEAPPGSSFGWHSHPGENVNVVKQGTLTLYQDESCTTGVGYSAGSSFPTHPDEVHLARNEGSQTLVFFATYFAPMTSPPTPVRVDEPSPGPECPL